MDRAHPRSAAREQFGEMGRIHCVRVLDADGDIHLHFRMRQSGDSKQRKRGVAQGVFDRAACGLGIVHAVQVVAHAHFDDHTLIHYARSISKDTLIAMLAITVGLPSGRGMSRPPWWVVMLICP